MKSATSYSATGRTALLGKYFDLTKVQDAHDRRNCRDENGSEAWACDNCDCTARLEQKLKTTGTPFLRELLTSEEKAAAKTPTS
ncbi:MAG: hypothetical protein WA824_10425 [Candidatus Sulfotelmatobacter sp.]